MKGVLLAVLAVLETAPTQADSLDFLEVQEAIIRIPTGVGAEPQTREVRGGVWLSDSTLVAWAAEKQTLQKELAKRKAESSEGASGVSVLAVVALVALAAAVGAVSGRVAKALP